MSVVVRQATRGDVPALLTLVERYWRFENIAGFDAQRLGPLLERVLVDESLGRAWLALVGGEPAGYLLVVFVFSLEHQGLTAEIDELFVMPAHRGHALGARLLEAAEAACRTAGCTNIALQLGRDNESARQFYRRKGYAARDGFELLDKDLD